MSVYSLHITVPDEWEALQKAGALPEVLPRPGSIILLVKAPDGQIVGRWAAVNTTALELLYIDPAHRGNPAVAKTLFTGMVSILKAQGVAEAITLIQAEGVEKLAITAGFDLLQGHLWRIDLDKNRT